MNEKLAIDIKWAANNYNLLTVGSAWLNGFRLWYCLADCICQQVKCQVLDSSKTLLHNVRQFLEVD